MRLGCLVALKAEAPGNIGNFGFEFGNERTRSSMGFKIRLPDIERPFVPPNGLEPKGKRATTRRPPSPRAQAVP